MRDGTAFWEASRPDEGAWLDHYWASWTAPYREILVGLVEKLGATGTLLEVGCHCGPNLRRLLVAHPDLRVVGMDCSSVAIAEGRRRLQACGLADRATLLHGTFPASMAEWRSGAVDLAATTYALAYVAPEGLVAALEELCRVARRGAVLLEPAGTGQRTERGAYVEWRHDYESALRTAVRGRRWWHYAIDPPAQGLDAAFIIGPEGGE